MNLNSCFVLLALSWMEFILNRWKICLLCGDKNKYMVRLWCSYSLSWISFNIGSDLVVQVGCRCMVGDGEEEDVDTSSANRVCR